jgi:uncharacterized protein YkwD
MKARILLGAAMLTVIGIAAGTTGINASSSPPKPAALSAADYAVDPNIWTQTELNLLALHNAARDNAGKRPLAPTNKMGRVADRRCQEITRNFSHTGWLDAFHDFGVRGSYFAENIARGYTSTNSVFGAWMNSSGHRRNILNNVLGRAGVGHCTKNGSNYWVVDFAG